VLRKVFFIILFLGPFGFADTEENLRLEVRYGAFTSRANQLDQTLLYSRKLTPWLLGEVGARVGEIAWGIQTIEYKGDLEVPITDFASVSLRLAHSWYPISGAGSTHLLFRGNLHCEVTSWFSLFGSFGWYERFAGLGGITVTPRLWRDTADHDFAMMAGGELRVSETIGLVGSLATFESINTFNLNNPYLQAAVKYGSRDDFGELYAFTRYRLLLGFGRMDEFMIGVGLKLRLDTPGTAPDHE
jgi:hypothetical protein